MTVIGDANTLLSWAATTMSTDGVDTSTVVALLPAGNLQGLVQVVSALKIIEDQVQSEAISDWGQFWRVAQDQIWAERPTVDFAVMIEADQRAKTVIKRLMRLTSVVRCRRLFLDQV